MKLEGSYKLNVKKEEVEAARGQLDARTFRQEFEASFENLTGLVAVSFSDENIEHNLQLVDEFRTIADDYSCTPAQLALAWVMAQDPDFVPIPGTKHVKFVEENAGAAELNIIKADLNKACEIFASGAVIGDRYHPTQMISLDPDEQ